MQARIYLCTADLNHPYDYGVAFDLHLGLKHKCNESSMHKQRFKATKCVTTTKRR